jgi:hypothetical protein
MGTVHRSLRCLQPLCESITTLQHLFVSQPFGRFIGDLLTHLRTERLGYDSDDKVLQHDYFDGIDFSGLYVGPGPFTVEFNGAGDTR